MSRHAAILLSLGLIVIVLFGADMLIGTTSLKPSTVIAALFGGSDCSPMERDIVINIRLLKAITALCAGMALSISGLQMQTLFRNPLAGPYVLGISAGASLGVALFILGAPILGFSVAGSSIGLAGAAWIGAASILLAIAILSRRISDIMVILILGMMLSAGVGSIVQILQYLSHEDALKNFVVWTMGSLNDITLDRLWILLGATTGGILLAIASIKSLNLLLMGEQYARTMGLNIHRSRLLIYASTTLLAGTITAFCGPIGFIGLAIPHLARAIMRDSDHRILLPATALTGAAVMLLCDIISKIYTLPINSITALVGIPVIAWIVTRKSR